MQEKCRHNNFEQKLTFFLDYCIPKKILLTKKTLCRYVRFHHYSSCI